MAQKADKKTPAKKEEDNPIDAAASRILQNKDGALPVPTMRQLKRPKHILDLDLEVKHYYNAKRRKLEGATQELSPHPYDSVCLAGRAAQFEGNAYLFDLRNLALIDQALVHSMRTADIPDQAFVSRPYLSHGVRKRLFSRNGRDFFRKANPTLAPFDCLHVPFTKCEHEKLIAFTKRRDGAFSDIPNGLLPGRTQKDIERYLKDEYAIKDGKLLQRLTEGRSALSSVSIHTVPTVDVNSDPIKIVSRPSCCVSYEKVEPGHTKRSAFRACLATESGTSRDYHDHLYFGLTEMHTRRIAGEVVGDTGAVSSSIDVVLCGKCPENEHLVAIGLGEKQDPGAEHALLFNVKNRRFRALENHSDGVSEVCWSKDARWLFTGGRDKFVNVYDTGGAFLYRANDGFHAPNADENSGNVVCLGATQIENSQVLAIGRSQTDKISVFNPETKQAYTHEFVYRARSAGRSSRGSPTTALAMAFGNDTNSNILMVGYESREADVQVGGAKMFEIGNGRMKLIKEVAPSNNDPVSLIQTYPSRIKAFLCSVGDEYVHIFDSRVGNSMGKFKINPQTSDRGPHRILNGSFEGTGYLFQTSGQDLCTVVTDYRRLGVPLHIFEHDMSSMDLCSVWGTNTLLTTAQSTLKAFNMEGHPYLMKTTSWSECGSVTSLDTNGTTLAVSTSDGHLFSNIPLI